MLIGRFKKFLLFGGDAILLYLALTLTLTIRYRQFPIPPNIWDQHLMPFTILFAVFLLIFYINGLYDIAASSNDIQFYNKLLRNLLIGIGLGAAYFYFLTDRLFDIKPRAVFFIFAALTLVLFFAWRYFYNMLVQRPAILRNVLIIGMKDEARELVEEIIKKPQLGYKIAAIIHDGYQEQYKFGNVAMYDSSINIATLLKTHNIAVVVTSLNPHTTPGLVKHLYESLALKLQFFDLPTFYEKLTGKIPVTTIGHIWFLENLAESEKTIYEIFKRLLDIAASILILTITLPFMPFIALGIKIDSKGPVFFRQHRVGALSKKFLAIKFRSMITGAEAQGQPQWAKKDDPRITRMGKFLRKTRLDEVPQLLNVLRGEMSLIGPRPERPEFVQELERIIPFYNERHLVKPGLTGWAQINFGYGASPQDALKKLQYDLFYIKNRSLPLDIGILLKTLNIIMTGRGR